MSTKIEVVNGPIPQRTHVRTSYSARRSLALGGFPYSIQEAWGIEVRDEAPLLRTQKN